MSGNAVDAVAVCPACRGSGSNVFFYGAPCHVCDGWRVVLIPPRPATVPTDGHESVHASRWTPPAVP